MYRICLLYGCGGFVNLASGFCGAGLREKRGKFVDLWIKFNALKIENKKRQILANEVDQI